MARRPLEAGAIVVLIMIMDASRNFDVGPCSAERHCMTI